MIQSNTLLPVLFCILVCFGVPLSVSIAAARKSRRYLVPFFVGALTFFVTQILLRIPIMQLWLAKQDWFLVLNQTNPLAYGLILGVSASVFEETGRYVSLRLLYRKGRRPDWCDGICFGAGHGGIEAILLVGINYLVALILYGGAPGAPIRLILFAGLERLFTMASHIGMTMMVMQSVRKITAYGLILALITHAAMDTGVVLMQLNGFSMGFIEFFIAVVGILLLAYAWHTKRDFEDQSFIGHSQKF